MLGQTISHYRIVSQLGVGGMGVVFEGLDPRLGRPVAIKFVPEELSHDPKSLERLRSEARTASGLNHPNICTIYDVGEHEGRPFIVMELLKGQTLRDRIATKPLKMHEAVQIGIEVADALECAHTAHIIHRDIKPANLFIVERGQVKVLDFGLAKLLTRDLGTQLTLAPTVDKTAAGIAMGTVAYMSPEQVQGEELDGRTDLFSLGVVLYECVTGHQPFTGKTSAVVFAQILTQAPTAPIALNPGVPPRLQDVINNCLEKDREMRYQEAASLRAELKRVKRDLESGAASVAITGAIATTAGEGKGSSGTRTTMSVPIAADPNAATAAVPSSGGTPSSLKNPWVAFGMVAALIALGGAWFGWRDSTAPAPTTQNSAPAAPAPTASAARVTPPGGASSAAAPSVAAETSPAPAATAAAPPPVSASPASTAPASTPPASATATADRANAEEKARLDAALAEAARLRAQVEAERRAAADRARAAEAAARENARRPATTAAPSAPAAPAATPPQAPAAEPGVPAAQVPPPRPVEAAAPPATATRVEPPSPRTPTPAAPPPTVEDDDAAIRRVVANYARAIENKSLPLFREVKPNLTNDEARRIEEGFRAVSSQRVTIAVDSIEHRGQDAIVRLRRHDVIQAGGRQQTADSQQTMTLTRTNGAWVIREIGR